MTSSNRSPRSRTRRHRGPDPATAAAPADGDQAAALAVERELDAILGTPAAVAGMSAAAATALHAQLRFRTQHHQLPTKIGAALRATVERHAPTDGGVSHGPGTPVCRGEGFPVTYPCPTTADIATALGVELPTRSG